MHPISNVDRLVLILRQRLQERARASSVGKRHAKGAAAGEGPANPMDTVQALAAVEAVDDQQLKRALIQGVLAENLGRGLINDASFQQMVDRVTDTLDRDPDLGGLLARVVADLRAAARP
jgi:hypothetical protein